MQEILQYLLDAAVAVLFLRMYLNSRKVEKELSHGSTLVVTVMLGALAALSFLHDTGFMKWFQPAFIIAMAVVYRMLKSGFSPEGIVSMGSLIPYGRITNISYSRKNSTIYFTRGKQKTGIYVKPEAFDDIRNYVESHRGK
ncbi:MAG: hypothetical protein IKD69_10195 [Solobacterium sp.]|nr:hypothetical protein [Solobacterium sp.]